VAEGCEGGVEGESLASLYLKIQYKTFEPRERENANSLVEKGHQRKKGKLKQESRNPRVGKRHGD